MRQHHNRCLLCRDRFRGCAKERRRVGMGRGGDESWRVVGLLTPSLFVVRDRLRVRLVSQASGKKAMATRRYFALSKSRSSTLIHYPPVSVSECKYYPVSQAQGVHTRQAHGEVLTHVRAHAYAHAYVPSLSFPPSNLLTFHPPDNHQQPNTINHPSAQMKSSSSHMGSHHPSLVAGLFAFIQWRR